MSAAYPPFARPGKRVKTLREEDLPPISRFIHELPSIDDFLDELQPIEDFVYDEIVQPKMSRTSPPSIDDFTETEANKFAESGGVDDGWVMDDLNSYDLFRIATLGRQSAESMVANNDWNATDWALQPADSEEQGHAAYHAEHRPTPHEVATALDEIARRIRAGELTIDQFHGSPPEAAMAAALAALIRMRS